ncbi:MAG: phosphotransferase [Actinobacteria bacterium]|nr:phosphotransferase [Actinomycetota bacterium]
MARRQEPGRLRLQPGTLGEDPPVDEERFLGGDLTPYVRVGDTVRHPAGPWTPTVRRLLTHLRERGFEGVPEPLGFDSEGRETLKFIEGEVGYYPLPTYVWSAEMLGDIARLIRRLHDASADLPTSDADHWRLPERRPADIICHNDLAPYNVVFRGGRPVGVIDFDNASPGPREWDLAYAAYRFVPLADPENPDVPFVPLPVQSGRLDLFLENYGSEISRERVVELLPARLEALIEFTGVRAETEEDELRDGLKEHRNIYERDLLYVRKNVDALMRSA